MLLVPRGLSPGPGVLRLRPLPALELVPLAAIWPRCRELVQSLFPHLPETFVLVLFELGCYCRKFFIFRKSISNMSPARSAEVMFLSISSVCQRVATNSYLEDDLLLLLFKPWQHLSWLCLLTSPCLLWVGHSWKLGLSSGQCPQLLPPGPTHSRHSVNTF